MAEVTDTETYPSGEDVAAVLAEFDGDALAAVRALLHDLDMLARDYQQSVSKGYVRGTLPWQRRA